MERGKKRRKLSILVHCCSVTKLMLYYSHSHLILPLVTLNPGLLISMIAMDSNTIGDTFAGLLAILSKSIAIIDSDTADKSIAGSDGDIPA
jgi:hypothetical protein